jgi:photosystem II stability/assembly factor-like uncharacterized protein/subtilisin-like proprotein convertase family protein
MNDLSIRTVIVVLLCFLTTALTGQIQLGFLEDTDLTFDEKVEKAELFFDQQGRGKGTGYKQFLRWKYRAQRTLDSDGYVLTEENSIKEYERFVEKNASSQRSMNTWVEKGPLSATNTTTWSSHIGRLSNIAIDPNNDNHLIVTSLGGGLWKTLDEGSTWTPLFDQESSMSLQSAMISHGNADHYYVGGSGIWKSEDGGMTFTKLNGPSSTIYSIIQDPNNADIVLASSRNGRVYRTTDGGATWTNVLVQSNRYLYDLEFKPGDPNTVYTGGRDGAMYMSADQGLSWTAITGPWNTSRDIMFATTADDPNYLYVLQEKSGGFGALYLSIDGGNTWTTQSSDNAGNNNIMGYNLNQTGGQAPRDMDIVVNPRDKTEVHVAGIMTFKSTDSGVTWTQTTHWVLSNPLPFVHADIDQLIYTDTKLYVASDGGIFISEDGANSFIDKTTGLGIRQFYRISASTTEVERIAGGSQDNGTGVLRGGVWYDFVGADGMEPCILDNDDDVIIASIQYGNLRKSTDGGTSLSSISQTEGGSNGDWVTPLEKDPNMANVIYQGKNQLYKSLNAGLSWTAISDFSGLGDMDELCIAPSNSQIIFAAFGNTLHKTMDGGATWNSVNLGGLASNINYINIHPTNSDHIILAMSNNNRFIESTDGGATWASIRYNLPNIGAWSVVFDGTANNGIYVSMSKGVYYKDDSSPTTWTLMDTGLPKTEVRELEIINDKLYAATYGRGLWEMPITGKGYTLNVNAALDSCISQGTLDTLDDAFTFIIQPNGMNLGATYSISGAVTASNLPYDSVYVVDNGGTGFLKQNGGVNIVITDDANSAYTKSVQIFPNLYENCYSNYYCVEAFDIEGTGTYSARGPNSGSGATVSGRSANWFRFVPLSDGLLSIASCGYGEDTNLKVHKGVCGNLIEIASSDDACTMGSGLNDWASQVENIPVEDSEVIYIEWDSRWSGNPFQFDVTFEEECLDYLAVDITHFDDTAWKADSIIRLSGTLSSDITAKTKGDVFASEVTVVSGGNLTVIDEDCSLNNTQDLRVIMGKNTSIPDLDTLEVLFSFPNTPEAIEEFGVQIDLSHPRISDLEISIIAPDGSTYSFWENDCSNEEDLNFVLDDEGVTIGLCNEAYRAGIPLYSTDLLSAQDIIDLKNETITGDWKLRFVDSVAGMSGTLNQAFIDFQTN